MMAEDNRKMLRLVAKPGSKARRDITEATGISRYTGNKNNTVAAIINYGLCGDHLSAFLKKYPAAAGLPMLNKNIGCPKYTAVKAAETKGIIVPETRLSLSKEHKLEEWIIKKQHSIGGIGIKYAPSKDQHAGHYYQRFVKNRKYELRVHAFTWTNCTVQKRLGKSDVIAWNFKNGGHFISVQAPEKYKIFREAIQVALKVLEIRAMAFGAVDFIVDAEGKLYFIEVNSSPGFTDFSKHIYVDAFIALAKCSKAQILGLCK
jgi:hypothetical protein